MGGEFKLKPMGHLCHMATRCILQLNEGEFKLKPMGHFCHMATRCVLQLNGRGI
jgi:hypothetical protein